MLKPDDRLVGLVREALPDGEVIGVALSGGGDSTALLHLCLAAGFRVEAVTVDHRLRPESRDEAAGVAAGCARLGIPHEVRVWTHGPVPGNLMDAARRARLGLILAWAQARGIRHVALGHTRDDQAETFLMGLARQAGIAGLSGMRPQWVEAGVTFHRPLLAAGREELRGWLRSRGLAWVEDPSNRNPQFQRVKARAALAALAPLGITAEGLARVAGHLGQVQAALAVQLQAASRHVTSRAGALKPEPDFWAAPEEVQRQVITQALLWLNGAEHGPRSGELRRFMAALRAGRDATLAGCRCQKGWLMREARAAGGPVRTGQPWDGRWLVEGPEAEVRALGGEGLRQCPGWRATGLPRKVVEVTPGVWSEGRLLAAPLAGWPQSWSARLVASHHLFGLSD